MPDGMLLAVGVKPRMPGRRPTSPESRAGLGAAFVLLALITIGELADGPRANYLGLLAAAPFLAAAFASWRQVLVVGGTATVLGVAFGLANPMGLTVPLAVNLVGIVLATGIAAAVGAIRQRQAERFAELSRLASVAQGAVLRPLGPNVGPLAIAARYISASAAADIGGDLYEALDTPYGVRMIIGDVRGKGLDAVRLASIVLGSYRHVAYERADLRAIVADLDRAVARSVGDEDFVTAALIEERGGTLTIVNCGHPPPLLLRRGEVTELEPPAPAPPLGFRPVVRARVERRRVAVAVGVARGQVLAREAVDLGEDAARGAAVQVGVRRGAEHPFGTEHLEEVELQVAEVAPVVAHRVGLPRDGLPAGSFDCITRE